MIAALHMLHKIISITSFWCYGKQPSLFRVRAKSTIVLDPLSSAMVNDRDWFASVLYLQWQKDNWRLEKNIKRHG